MGWLRSLVCFLSNSRRLTEEEEGEPGNGGAAMAPITRSQCKISRLVDLNTLDAKFSNTTRPFLLRSSKRQRIKEEALKEYDIGKKCVVTRKKNKPNGCGLWKNKLHCCSRLFLQMFENSGMMDP